MTEQEYNAALQSGAISAEPVPEEQESAPASSSDISIEQFIPILLHLQSTQRCLTAAPTFIPQTLMEQIQFVFTGGNYYCYLYFNNQWNSFSVTGGGGATVAQILAGTGISLSPSGGTGNVTITCTIDDATLPTSDITTNNVSTSKHGFAPKLPNDATKFLNGIGTFTAPPAGASFAVSTGSISNVNIPNVTFTTSVQNDDTVVTHGLGTTPKIITISISDLIAPSQAGGGTSSPVNVMLYITFDNTGFNAAGITFYIYNGGALQMGGNTLSWAGPGSVVQGTLTISLVSIGSTTFTFRVAYSKNNSGNCGDGQVNGITYMCQG